MSKFKPIANKISLWLLFISFAIVLIFYLYNYLFTYQFLKEEKIERVKEVSRFFKDDILITISFDDFEGVKDVIKKIDSIENILRIDVFYHNTLLKSYSKIQDLREFEDVGDVQLIVDDKVEYFIYKYELDKNSYIKLYYLAKDYILEIDNYKRFTFYTTIFLLMIIFLLSVFIKKLLEPLSNLAIRLREIDFYNFKPIKLENIDSNDERALISNSIKVMFDKIDSVLDELNSLNRSLEEKVLIKTQELNRLNLDLKEQVKIEVEKNRQKDKVMFQQARLAQMGEMIGNIAHQWRQPLNEIGLVIQSFELAHFRGDLDSEFIENRVDKANQIINSMSNTIDDFRNFFNPTRSKATFNISESIKKAIFMVKASFDNNSIDLVENLSEEVNFIGFENEFEQVVLNILSNAKDVLIEREILNARVEVNLYVDDKIYIEILDNAKGIDLDIIDRIFEPYFTTKPQGKGSGIGLYMSKQILENMRGDIGVMNTIDGAKFLISLPLGDK